MARLLDEARENPATVLARTPLQDLLFSGAPSLSDYVRRSGRRSGYAVSEHAIALRPQLVVRATVTGKSRAGVLLRVDVAVNSSRAWGDLELSPLSMGTLNRHALLRVEDCADVPVTEVMDEWTMGNVVFAMVHTVEPERDRVTLSLDAATLPAELRHVRLGRQALHEPHQAPNFMALLRDFPGLKNPQSTAQLQALYGLEGYMSQLDGLRGALVRHSKLASTLRRRQDHQLAKDKVAEGVRLQLSGKLKDAVSCYDRALQVEPRYADALVARGSLHTTNGDFELAIADLDAAVAVDAQHRNAAKYLEITLMRRAAKSQAGGRFESALADLTKAADIHADKHADVLDAVDKLKTVMHHKALSATAALAAARASFGGGGGGGAARALLPHSSSDSVLNRLRLRLEGEKAKGNSRKRRRRESPGGDSVDGGVSDNSQGSAGVAGASRDHHPRRHSTGALDADIDTAEIPRKKRSKDSKKSSKVDKRKP